MHSLPFVRDILGKCPSLDNVKTALRNAERLNFDLGLREIPEAWFRLREEARPIFAEMNIWHARLETLEGR